MTLQDRLHELITEPTLQDVIEAGQFPTPEEYQKMIWMLHWCKSTLNKEFATTIASDLKGILPEMADEPLTDEELEAAGINPQRHKDALTGRNNAIREIQFAIDRYCELGEMQSKQEPKEK